MKENKLKMAVYLLVSALGFVVTAYIVVLDSLAAGLFLAGGWVFALGTCSVNVAVLIAALKIGSTP